MRDNSSSDEDSDNQLVTNKRTRRTPTSERGSWDEELMGEIHLLSEEEKECVIQTPPKRRRQTTRRSARKLNL